MIELNDIWKTFATPKHSVQALKGVSITIKEGDMLSVMGQSGSGKSSFLNILGMLSKQTSGEYFFNQEDVSRLNDSQRAALRNQYIGFVFQASHLLPMMTAQENVALPLYYAGFSRSEAFERANQLLGRLGLADRATHRPAELSGGQQQRVAIARAMSNFPRLLVADEPTGALDQSTSEEIMAIFNELNSEDNVTILIVTHDPNVATHCQRQLVMQEGVFS